MPICRELYTPSIDAYVDEKKSDSSMDHRNILTPSIDSVYDDSNNGNEALKTA